MTDVPFVLVVIVAALAGGGVVALCACPPNPPPPAVTVLDADGAVVPVTPEGACAHLAELKCQTAGPQCVPGLKNMASAGLTPVDLVCIQAAKDKLTVQACRGMGAGSCP